MKLRIFICISLIMAFGSCGDDDVVLFNTCGVSEPLRDLPWLKEMINTFESNRGEMYPFTYISQAQYLHKTVFIIGNCCPYCNTILPVLDCEGNTLFYRYDEDRAGDIVDETVIWQAEGSECNFL